MTDIEVPALVYECGPLAVARFVYGPDVKEAAWADASHQQICCRIPADLVQVEITVRLTPDGGERK